MQLRRFPLLYDRRVIPDFLTQHLELVPPKISELRPVLGDRFDALLEHLLQKPIKKRPRSVEEVRRTIEEIDWRDPDENELKRRMKTQIDSAIKTDRLKPSEGMRLLHEYERGLKNNTYLKF